MQTALRVSPHPFLQNTPLTTAENVSNRPTKGAYFTRNRWRAQIQTKGKNIHLGYYSTEAEAVQAYQKAASELKGQFYFPYA
jgi:hypothetical protein